MASLLFLQMRPIIRGPCAKRHAYDTGWPRPFSAQAQMQCAPELGSLFGGKTGGKIKISQISHVDV